MAHWVLSASRTSEERDPYGIRYRAVDEKCLGWPVHTMVEILRIREITQAEGGEKGGTDIIQLE